MGDKAGSITAVTRHLRLPEDSMPCELNLKWPDQPAGKFPADALKIALQMGAMAENLVLMARCDQEQLHISSDQFHLRAVDYRCVEAAASQAADRGPNVNLSGADDPVLTTDHSFVFAIVNNQVGNAVEPAPPDSEIRIECGRQRDRFELSIHNAAPDLTPGVAERLCDRFWRSDTARSSNEHFGLGLALSRTLAERLGFKLVARLTDGFLTITLSDKPA